MNQTAAIMSDGEAALSYAELTRDSIRLAHLLRDRGLAAGIVSRC